MATMWQRSKRAVIVALALVVLLGVTLSAVYYGVNIRANGKEAPAKRGAPAVPVTVAPVRTQSMPLRLPAIGNVEAFATVALKARVDGQIVAVLFKEGEPVTKGEVLFRIDPRPFEAALRQAEANALRDQAARDQARSQARRYEELLAKNFVSKEAYAQIRTNAEIAEATARASQASLENARLNLEYCTIRAPIDGYVGKVLLQAGNLVKANDPAPLVVINQVRPIYVNFAVAEQNLASIRKYAARNTLAVEASPPGASAPAATGRLVFIDNAVDASTGTVRLRARFANQDLALWPGQFVGVSLRLYEQKGAIVVPSPAVQTGPEGDYVFLLREDSTVEVRPVKVERTEGGLAVVASGLAPGERVVTSGQLRLGPNTRVQIREPGGKRPAAAPDKS
jgi:multidrug efflux system membrane fusion protein